MYLHRHVDVHNVGASSCLLFLTSLGLILDLSLVSLFTLGHLALLVDH